MVEPHRNAFHLTILLIFLSLSVNAIKYKPKHTCPIGFNLAYNKYNGDEPICYRRKGPEAFTDKFKDCDGNLYTSKLYHSLNFTEPNLVLWTDYKTLYPGGPFIDWSYTGSTGDILLTTYEVKYDLSLGLDEDLCVIIDPVSNFTATRCEEKHYRYCFVRPYVREDEMVQDGCEDNYLRFFRPKATCLTALTGVSRGAVRANWRQAKDLCAKRGGSLLNKGWRYANNPLLSTSSDPIFPLGIILNPDNTSIRFDSETDRAMIPSSEWHFEEDDISPESSLGALRDSFWYLVNSSYIFYDVICEKSLELKSVNLNVSFQDDGRLILSTNDTIDESDLYCFSDSVIYFPSQIKARHVDDTNVFVLKPIADGYYWCVHVDSQNFHVSESNMALYINVKQSLINYYAIKIRLRTEYKFENMEQFYRDWRKKLEEYIFYRTKYVKTFGELELSDPYTTERVLKSFKASHPALKWKENDLIYTIKIKRLYLDGKTALLHVQLNSEMMPVPPGHWDDLEVASMKPVYFCKEFDSVPMTPLGQSVSTVGCKTYTCIGDFNEGVQWVTTATEGCTTATPATATTYVKLSDRAIQDVMPTAFPPAMTTVSLLMPTVFEPSTTLQDLPYARDDVNDDSSEEETRRPQPPTTTTTTTTEMENISDTYIPEVVSTVTTTDATEAVSISTLPPITTTPIPPPPEEQLQQVLDDLEALLQNDTGPVTVEDINSAFDQVDSLLDAQEALQIPGQLLHLLDEIGARLDLNNTNRGSAVRANIALLLADAQPGSPVRGLRIAARDDDIFTDNAFEIISEQVNSTHLASNESEAVVELPESIASSTRRISFVVFRNDRAFQSNNGYFSVNSRVLSINVENLTQFENGEVVDIHLTPIIGEPDRNQSRTCAFWHFQEDGSGYWSQEGCTFIRATEEGMLDTCRCDHLTHFAEILVPRAVFSERSEAALEILTIIGCCLSMFGLAMVGLTAALFRSWRRDFSNKIWLQLCIAIFILVLCFLVIIFAKFDNYDVPCMLVGVMLHYSVLASFCWMLVAAVLSYRRLVIVFTRDASHKLLRASAFAWGAPCAVVGILLSVAPHSYAGRFEEKSPSGSFCYPSGLSLWLTVYAPAAAMLLANWTLFVLIVRSVFASRRIQRHGDTNEAIRCASVSCLLVFLFGLPWLFGLFAYNVVSAYLFTLTATFQGFILFLFFVLGNKKTRDLWLNKLKIKQTRKVPVTSSTFTNRSTPGSRGPVGTTSMEANSSKPRSLSSPDNSRFS